MYWSLISSSRAGVVGLERFPSNSRAGVTGLDLCGSSSWAGVVGRDRGVSRSLAGVVGRARINVGAVSSSGMSSCWGGGGPVVACMGRVGRSGVVVRLSGTGEVCREAGCSVGPAGEGLGWGGDTPTVLGAGVLVSIGFSMGPILLTPDTPNSDRGGSGRPPSPTF